MQLDDAAQLVTTAAETFQPAVDVIDLEQPGVWGLQVSDVDVVACFQSDQQIFTLQTFDEFPQTDKRIEVLRMLLRRNTETSSFGPLRVALDPRDGDIISEIDVPTVGLDGVTLHQQVDAFASAVRDLRGHVLV